MDSTKQTLYWLNELGVTEISSDLPFDFSQETSPQIITHNQYTNIQNKNNIAKKQEQVVKTTKEKTINTSSSVTEIKNVQSKYQIISPHEAIKQAQELAESANSIKELHNAITNFDGCILKKTATNTVFADGVEQSDLMLIGEAPGANEDQQGIPFCGDSGKILDAMLQAIGRSRQQNAYITNAIFWRPPGNRRPSKDEIAICLPFVEKHIALTNPKLIILVGGTAASTLLGDKIKISDIRQNYYQYQNKFMDHKIPMTALFHPAYLMRQPSQKKHAWYDLIKIQQYLQEVSAK